MYGSPSKPPAGIFVCSESRYEYLKTWRVLPTQHCLSPSGQAATIYFAYDRDILEFSNDLSRLPPFRYNPDPAAPHKLPCPPLQNTEGILRLSVGFEEQFEPDVTAIAGFLICVYIHFRDLEIMSVFYSSLGLNLSSHVWNSGSHLANSLLKAYSEEPGFRDFPEWKIIGDCLQLSRRNYHGLP